MISSLDIALKIRQRLNKVDTQDDENLPVYVIVEAYNKGQLNIVNKLSSKNNIYKTGVESTTFRVDDLQILINSIPKPLSVTKKYDYYITETLPKDYLRYIRTYCSTSNEICPKRDIKIYLQEESNLNTLLSNEFINPSFEWAETIATIAENKIKVFTQGKFKIDYVYLTYLRKPRNIDIVGYIKKDGNSSTTIDPELPDDLVEMSIDEACRILSGDMQNQFSNQISQQNLQNTE